MKHIKQGNEVQDIRVTVENKQHPEQRDILKQLLAVVAERSLFYFDESEMADNDPDDYIRLALNDTVEDYRLYMQSKDESLKPTCSLRLVEGVE